VTFCDSFDSIGLHLTVAPNDLLVIVTRGHKHDLECLDFALAGEEPFYLGMIGSRRRVAIIRQNLKSRGVDPERLARVHAPIGLDIGAVTPEEIALSILAETVQVRRFRERDRGLGRQEDYADLSLVGWLAEEGPPPEGAALVTVSRTSGSTPRKAGAKMAVMFDGRIVGSIGGGCAEAGVIAAARELIGRGGHSVMTVDLTDRAEEDGMVCGGSMDLLLEDLGLGI
jgi:xanthine dehydrogenase accessory factor